MTILDLYLNDRLSNVKIILVYIMLYDDFVVFIC